MWVLWRQYQGCVPAPGSIFIAKWWFNGMNEIFKILRKNNDGGIECMSSFDNKTKRQKRLQQKKQDKQKKQKNKRSKELSASPTVLKKEHRRLMPILFSF